MSSDGVLMDTVTGGSTGSRASNGRLGGTKLHSLGSTTSTESRGEGESLYLDTTSWSRVGTDSGDNVMLDTIGTYIGTAASMGMSKVRVSGAYVGGGGGGGFTSVPEVEQEYEDDFEVPLIVIHLLSYSYRSLYESGVGIYKSCLCR
eukprot:1165508-Prorocentrum_minimum.AAC.1